jgi:hypothetical protein
MILKLFLKVRNPGNGEVLRKDLEGLGIPFKDIHPSFLKTIFVPPPQRGQIIIHPIRNNAPLFCA